MSTATHVRFPLGVDARLSAYAGRAGRPKSTVVVAAVGEWLLMEAHPGIRFVATVTGERRAVLAAGPQVWTVAAAWLQQGAQERTSGELADTLGLTRRDVEAALGYWAECREEIDGLIARHHAEQDDALAAWERRQAIDAL